jgi:SAM-dependent methyltransferase
MSADEADAQRAEMLGVWERAAPGWGERADEQRVFGMPVSAWMIDHLELHPGEELLELAAGPGDTGFMAAELIQPGGTLICSDAAEAMIEVARARAARLGIENVRFQRLELEWLDLPAASVDAILCRWGIMLILDPAAAAREARRVLRPGGGRIALSVWAAAEHNPWATVPTQALVELDHIPPPDRNQPGLFALAAPGGLRELLEGAGFGDIEVETIELERAASSVAAFIAQTRTMSGAFAEAVNRRSESERLAVEREIATLAEPYTDARGAVRFPARALVAVATA